MGKAKWHNTRMVHRMLSWRWGATLLLLLLLILFPACQQGGNSYLRTPRAVNFRAVGGPIVPRTVGEMAKEANIKMRIMPKNARQRRRARSMTPSFITIHSTANHACTATAMQHSRALCTGAFSNRNWHFSVDQYMVVQNLPLDETAWHAGRAEGNNHSIGIEMCEAENRGDNHFRTWDRTAKLTAILMMKYKINLRRVVPHHHWTGKNCPSPLLDNGRPGGKWAWFVSRIDYYYRCMNQGQSFR